MRIRFLHRNVQSPSNVKVAKRLDAKLAAISASIASTLKHHPGDPLALIAEEKAPTIRPTRQKFARINDMSNRWLWLLFFQPEPVELVGVIQNSVPVHPNLALVALNRWQVFLGLTAILAKRVSQEELTGAAVLSLANNNHRMLGGISPHFF